MESPMVSRDDPVVLPGAYMTVGNAAVPMRITIEKRDGEWMVLDIELPDEILTR